MTLRHLPPLPILSSSTILTLSLIFLCSSLFSNAQRDLMAIDPSNQYLLPVTDSNGKQLMMGGPDPRLDKPKHPSMCYITPWNQQTGRDFITDSVDRLHYVSPAWYQLHLEIVPTQSGKSGLGVKITGGDNVDVTFLQNVWERFCARRYVPKITPRVSLQLSKQAIQILLNVKTHVSIIEALLEMVHTGGLPLISHYKGYDGIVLEMPSVWKHLPPYPNDILSFVPPQEEKCGDDDEKCKKSEAKNNPIDPNFIDSLDNSDQRADNYGTYHYDFTKTHLEKHPRHIINTFVRKLGVALQSHNKSLLIVAAPYQYHEDPAQNFTPNKPPRPKTTLAKNGGDDTHDQFKQYDSLDCLAPNQVTFPQAFSHIDAYYLSPYVDYFNLMTYDFVPNLSNDIHHIRDVEKQTRTVATTRVGHGAKRLWRTFIGESGAVNEGMFLEDYIRFSENGTWDEGMKRIDEEESEHFGNEQNNQSDTNNNKEIKSKYPKPPKFENIENNNNNNDDSTHHELTITAYRRELQIRSEIQRRIDLLEGNYNNLVDKNILKRNFPRRDYMMCFNPLTPLSYYVYNPISAICSEFEEPGQWWNRKDITHFRSMITSHGVDNDLPEEVSDDEHYKQMKPDTLKELTDSIEIHKLKLMRDFSLSPDKPWPYISYGWTISPTTWMKNSIYALNTPFQCLKKIISNWDNSSVNNVPISYAVELLKKTSPKTTISRDLVIPVKLEKIQAKFDLYDNLSVSLRNSTVAALCSSREVQKEAYEKWLAENLNSAPGVNIPPLSPPNEDKDLEEACRLHAELIQNEKLGKEEEKAGKSKVVQNKKQDGLDNDIEIDEVIENEIPPPKPTLDWSFPSLKLDFHIQNKIDKNPKFNKIRTFAGMNWYGYMYVSRDDKVRFDEYGAKRVRLDDDIDKNGKNDKNDKNDNNLELIEPIALTAEQVKDIVTKWKGQIDIKHDLASGDRFFLMRDGPENNIIKSIWYPSYRQLHRKLHNIRSIADGVGVWECGQGGKDFEQLI